MKTQLITIWMRWSEKEQRWEHNHHEDGWGVPTNEGRPKPAGTGPMFENQRKSWAGGKWWKDEGYLVGHPVGRVYTRTEYIRLLVKGHSYRNLPEGKCQVSY